MSNSPSKVDAYAAPAYLSLPGRPIGLVTAIARAAAGRRPRRSRPGSARRTVAGSFWETPRSAMKAAPETHAAFAGNAVRRCSINRSGFPMKGISTWRYSIARRPWSRARTFTPMKCCHGFTSPTTCRVNEPVTSAGLGGRPRPTRPRLPTEGHRRRLRLPDQLFDRSAALASSPNRASFRSLGEWLSSEVVVAPFTSLTSVALAPTNTSQELSCAVTE